MNKLYTINFTLPNGYIISTYNVWSAEEQEEKIKRNPDWKYKLKEDNETHKIYTAR